MPGLETKNGRSQGARNEWEPKSPGMYESGSQGVS